MLYICYFFNFSRLQYLRRLTSWVDIIKIVGFKHCQQSITKQSLHNDESKSGLDLSASHYYDVSIIYKRTNIIDECNVVYGDRLAKAQDKSGG